MHKRLLVVASVLILGTAVLVFVAMRQSARARALIKQSRVALHRCDTSVYGRDALCGTYEVYEDRVARSGRKIPLNIVVHPASGSNPVPDPVFWLAGGPGGAATELAKTPSSKSCAESATSCRSINGGRANRMLVLQYRRRTFDRDGVRRGPSPP